MQFLHEGNTKLSSEIKEELTKTELVPTEELQCSSVGSQNIKKMLPPFKLIQIQCHV